MRILVAGWHGQVARALSERVASRTDVAAYAVGRAALDLSGHPAVGRTLFGIEPDVIVNTAGYTDVDGAEDEPDKALHHNTSGAAALAAFAARRGLPIIHLSSSHVFSGTKTGPYVEADETGPLNAYGRSKLAAEQRLADANPHHIIVRTGWIFSPYGHNFTKSMLRRAHTEREIKVVTDQIGSPTYAPHLADALLELCARVVDAPGSTQWGTYHAAGGGYASWFEIADYLFERSGKHGGPAASIKPIAHADYPTRSQRAKNACLDCTRLRQTFAIGLPDWRQGVDECVSRIIRQSG